MGAGICRHNKLSEGHTVNQMAELRSATRPVECLGPSSIYNAGKVDVCVFACFLFVVLHCLCSVMVCEGTQLCSVCRQTCLPPMPFGPE